MIPDEEPIFGAGHNVDGMLSKEDAIADLREFLHERVQRGDKTYAQRRDEFIRSANAAVVRNRDTAGAAADVIKLGRAVWDEIEAARRERSNPYFETHGALKGVADEFWLPVILAFEDLQERIAAWDAAEDQRIADQRREQETALAGLSPGAPTPAVRPAAAKRRPVRGDYGGKVTQTQQFDYEIVDIRQVPDFILNTEPVKAAIVQVVKSMTKLGATIPGIKATPVTVTRAG